MINNQDFSPHTTFHSLRLLFLQLNTQSEASAILWMVDLFFFVFDNHGCKKYNLWLFVFVYNRVYHHRWVFFLVDKHYEMICK